MTPHSSVVWLPVQGTSSEHERAVQQILAEKLGKLLGCPFIGDYSTSQPSGGRYYFLPDDTLVGDVSALGIDSDQDLFGGVVKHAFVATKAISHPLISEQSRHPDGWSESFALQVDQVTLPGFTAFDLDDAHSAGQRLLRDGPLRLKPVLARAGRGQQSINDLAELETALAALDAQTVREHGLVLEEELRQPYTYSVGQITVAGVTLSYYGSQHLTRDNQGHSVYGGSELIVVRGDYLALMALTMPRAARLALQQARIYELAAFEAYPGLFASRRNYDVACGESRTGKQRCGVLEQSWRVGGASPAEIFALEAFVDDPALRQLHASTFEHYGDIPPPRGAICLYQGHDDELGLLSKYVKVERT